MLVCNLNEICATNIGEVENFLHSGFRVIPLMFPVDD